MKQRTETEEACIMMERFKANEANDWVDVIDSSYCLAHEVSRQSKVQSETRQAPMQLSLTMITVRQDRSQVAIRCLTVSVSMKWSTAWMLAIMEPTRRRADELCPERWNREVCIKTRHGGSGANSVRSRRSSSVDRV